MDEPETSALTEPIPLSALQHAVYRLRQAALIHIERLWEENLLTAQGRALHETIDEPAALPRKDVRRVSAMALSCRRLGIAGTADLVEFRAGRDNETAYPVEFKRGKPKPHRADEVQLCAQALCLEEMTGKPVAEGALFYAQTKRRKIVVFDQELRRMTEDTVAALARVFATGQTPPAHYRAELCRACSLIDPCRPKAGAKSASEWRAKQIGALLADSAPEKDR
jgi:CRISPR-associated exonuclease Cas4